MPEPCRHGPQSAAKLSQDFVFVQGTKPSGKILTSNLQHIRSHAAKGKRRSYLRKPSSLNGVVKGKRARIHDDTSATSDADSTSDGTTELDVVDLPLPSPHGPLSQRRHVLDAIPLFLEDLVLPMWDREHLSFLYRASAWRQHMYIPEIYSLISARIQRCLVNDFHWNAMLSMFSGKHKFWSGPPLASVEFYIDGALSSLWCDPKSLVKKANEDIVVSLAFLCRAEWRAGRLDAACAYMGIIAKLIQVEGVFRPAAIPMTDFVMLTDKHLAITLFRPPMLPGIDPGPPPILKSAPGSIGMVAGCDEDVTASALIAELEKWPGCHELLELTSDIQYVLTLTRQEFSDYNPPDGTIRPRRWLFMKSNCWTYELLHFASNTCPGSSEPQNALAIAILLWLMLATAHDDSPRLGSAAFEKLLAVFEPLNHRHDVSDSSEGQLMDKTLLWIATLASLAASCPEQLRGFQRHASSLAEKLGLSSSRDLKLMLKTYLFPDNLIAPFPNCQQSANV